MATGTAGGKGREHPLQMVHYLRKGFAFNTVGIGTDATLGTFTNTNVDEVAVYPSALSSTLIALHYSARTGPVSGGSGTPADMSIRWRNLIAASQLGTS